ncbi:hypothetical protein M413DRAFT_73057, partial [Hebeloma cylindrosporum]
VEGRLLSGPSAPLLVVTCEVKEQVGMIREVFNELTVEVSKAQERLNLYFVCWCRLFLNTGYLNGVHRDTVLRDNDTEVLDGGFLKLTLLRFEVQLVLPHQLQDPSFDHLVFLQGVGEDGDII